MSVRQMKSAIPMAAKGIKPTLTTLGFVRAKRPGVFVRPRPGTDEHEVVWLFGHSKWSYPGVARSFTVHLGVSIDPEAIYDLGTTATFELERFLGDGPLIAEKCTIHNRIVEGFRGKPGNGLVDGDRVAMLLSWTVTTNWRGAPEVFWYSEPEDVELWVEYLGRALPVALARLSTATLDRSRPAVNLRLPTS